MTTIRMTTRRVEDKVPPRVEQGPQGVQVPQVEQVPITNEGNEVSVVPSDITNGEIREALLTLSRAMTTQVNRDIGPMMNDFESTMTSRLRDFVRINPPMVLGSMVGEDPQEYLDVWYTQWKDNRPVESGPIESEEFKETFLGMYFPMKRER
ncbi:hypothetical protein EJD97_003172 [Solanum chilense]|uniref:Uncharacterized protein n=1 Tax=Solanum chilense TaxID=4083 RepID=A0A6N2CBF9_SOLCI|nr:hypothetical protein EJD97_003172 [Solanum chilense]